MKEKITTMLSFGFIILLVAGWVALLLAPPFGTAIALVGGFFAYSVAKSL